LTGHVNYLSTDVPEVRAASNISALLAAARPSETSVDNYFPWQYIPEDKSELQGNKKCDVLLVRTLGFVNDSIG
jgi:hypothetical protein